MSDQEIIEGNRLIAEFMGLKKNERGKYNIGLGDFDDEDLSYHRLWEQLMPVAEKIEKETKAHIRIQVGICSITRKFMVAKKYAQANNIPYNEVPPIVEVNEYNFITNVWIAIVQFIEWHYQNE